MKTILFVLCLTTLLSVARAAEKVAPAVELKQKSSFDAADARNPFWPIGWKRPDQKDPNAVEAGPAVSPSAFMLTSVTMGAGIRFAILNGKVMQEGQQFGLQLGRQVYQVTVKAIEDGQVVLSSAGADIVVPLRRK